MGKFFTWMIGGVLAGGIIAIGCALPLAGGAVAVACVVFAGINAARWIAPAK